MSIWKKTMDYLGLGPDDAYDDYEDQNEPEPSNTRGRARRDGGEGRGSRQSSSSNRDWPAEPDEPAARSAGPRPSFPSRDFESQVRRTGQPGLEDSGTVSRPQPRSPAARGSAAPPNPPGEPATVRPRRFDQAQELADKFKDGQSVILNLESTDRDVARRLIDFASGVCYSLDGSMEKVATGVYLLKPAPGRATRYDDDYEG
jgi:cell division inhibitor SepF